MKGKAQCGDRMAMESQRDYCTDIWACGTEDNFAYFKMQLGSGPLLKPADSFWLGSMVLSYKNPMENGSCQGKRDRPLRSTTIMMKSWRSCSSNRAQTWTLNPKGVAKIWKKKIKKKEKESKKNKRVLNRTLDASGIWWCTFFQNKIACLIACTLLDKYFFTYFYHPQKARKYQI